MFRFEAHDAVARFRARCSGFFEGADILENAIDVAFNWRPADNSDNVAVVLFFLARRCVEDFREIALLASNGYGWGATAHLRGMYERAVVTAYLHNHPEQVNKFIDYDLVRRWRAAQKIKETFKEDPEDAEKLVALRRDYDAIVEQFRVTDCAKCQTTRINHSWNKLDFVSMAASVGTLGRAVVPAYYMPLGQAHATLASAVYQLSESSDGGFIVDQERNEAEILRSFKFGHLIVLSVLDVHHEHFRLAALSEPLANAWQHYKSAWNY